MIRDESHHPSLGWTLSRNPRTTAPANGTFAAELTLSYTDDEFAASDIGDEGITYFMRWTGGDWSACPTGNRSRDTAANTVTCSQRDGLLHLGHRRDLSRFRGPAGCRGRGRPGRRRLLASAEHRSGMGPSLRPGRRRRHRYRGHHARGSSVGHRVPVSIKLIILVKIANRPYPRDIFCVI